MGVMDINSRINWKPGMEITAGAMHDMASSDSLKIRVALRASMADMRMGRLPSMPFECQGVFVKNCFEVDHFRCMALLPSGNIVDADEDVTVNIPMLFGERYYLTIGIAEGDREFEKEGIPYVTTRYEYAIHSLQEIEENDLFPLVRFNAKNGELSIDTEFIPPCLLLKDDPRFQVYMENFTSSFERLAMHSNLAEGDGKRALLHYLFLLKGYNMDGSMQALLSLLQEIAQAIDYFVMKPNTEVPVLVPVASVVDPQDWLQWFENYLSSAIALLNNVVLENHTIDYEALLAQAKAELYSRLHPELIEKLLADLKEEVRAEMQRQTETITTYINDNLKVELEKHLSGILEEKTEQMSEEQRVKLTKATEEITSSLYEKLYMELFDNLFNALYVPEPEKEPFVPLI